MRWKQGVVIYMLLYTSLFYDTTPIHCTPPPTAPPCNEYPETPPIYYTPNLPTNIVDFRGCDSSVILFLRGGILMSKGDF